MAHSRNIKPGIYKNEDLAECSIWARYLFAMLPMIADREGRLEDRPKRIKGEVFPFDSIEVGSLLDELRQWNFIDRYEVDGRRYIQIVTFLQHQRPHATEKDSAIPDDKGFITVHSRGKNGCITGTCEKVPAFNSELTVNSTLDHALIHRFTDSLIHKPGRQQQGATTVGAPTPENPPQNQNPPELTPLDAESAPDPAPPPRTETPSAGQNPPRPEPIADAITMRAVDIAALLRGGGAALQPGDPRVRRWAERGDSDAVLLQALATANLRRDARQSPQPVNAGLLDSILDDALVRGGLTPPARASPATARADWVRAMCPNIAAKTGGEHGRDSGITIDGVADAVG